MSPEINRLRVKIGVHEFEAEGAPDWLVTQLDTWKELVSAAPASVVKQDAGGSRATGVGLSGADQPDATELNRIYAVDQGRKVVSLKVHPTGNQRDADAVLLLLFGFAQLLNATDVLAGTIKESMALSGLRVQRIDRVIAPHQTSGYVLKGGIGKGGKYRLTNTGDNRARELLSSLAS